MILLSQSNETIRANIQTWGALHNVSTEQGDANRAAYEAEKTRKYKMRLIDGWRAKALDDRLTFFPNISY